MSLIPSRKSDARRWGDLVQQVIALAIASTLSMPALSIEKTAPQEVGLSEARAVNLRNELQRRVDAGELPGAVFMAVRNGKIAVHQAVGFQDKSAKTPMSPDSIFRIASMTKPIVSTAIMMLAEQGKLYVSDPLSKHIPEFANSKVLVEKNSADGKSEFALESARREITIQDLLRHTSGLSYGQFDKSRVDAMYMEANLLSREQTLAHQVSKLATMPLKHQPGTVWDYSLSVDVLGRVVEVVTGKTLDVALNDMVLAPLKMNDTGFWVPSSKLSRLAQAQINPKTGKPYFDRPVDSPPMLLNGGGGMVSTAADYARFCQMMLNMGELEGVRILSRKSIELMTSNHLPPNVGFTNTVNYAWGNLGPRPEAGMGFGLGFAVRLENGKSTLPGSTGEYWWSGSTGTNFVIDPKEKLVLILLTQQPDRLRDYLSLMRQMGYAMILN
ncbi:MAG: serine hydrolase domain-containing protein [Rhodoferax sp.]